MRKLIATSVSAIVVMVGVSVTLSSPAEAFSLNTTPQYGFDFSTPNVFRVNSRVDVPIIKPAKEEPKVETKEETPKEVSKPKVITYKVQSGDTLSSIADKFDTTWERIWSKNKKLKDQDVIHVEQKLIIPSKDEKLKDRKPKVESTIKVTSTTTQGPNVAHRGSQTATEHVSGGPNAYTYGWCTWWVKEKRPDIGSYWGNAGYSWISSAQASGFSTGSTPRAGAIGVTSGHVVYVESVNGSTINISEMGWGYQANTSPNYRSTSASQFTYIY